jgi:hypothetical protein
VGPRAGLDTEAGGKILLPPPWIEIVINTNIKYKGKKD